VPSYPTDGAAGATAVPPHYLDRPRPLMRSGGRSDRRRVHRRGGPREPEGGRHLPPAGVSFGLQVAQVRRSCRDAAMAEKRANVLDRRSGRSPKLRRRVAQHVGRHVRESRRLGVAPQMRVQGRIGDGEDGRPVIANRPAGGRGGTQDRLPGRIRHLPAPDRATFSADLVQRDPVAVHAYAEAHEFASPQARQDCGDHKCPI